MHVLIGKDKENCVERARVGQGCADACPDKYGKYCL